MASSRRNLAVAAYVFLFLLVGGAAVLFFTVFENGTSPGDESGPLSAEGAGGGKSGPSAASLPGTAGVEALPGERVLVPPRGDESPRAVTVHGVVLDPEGAFMPGVVVLFRRPFPGAPGAPSFPPLPPREVPLVEGAVRSGSGGDYSLALVPGEYVLSASVPTAKRGHRLAFEPERVEVPPAERFRHDIRFVRPACTVRGVVLCAGRGPVPGVGVALTTTAGDFLRRTESGGDGRWAFDGVAFGAYRIFVGRGREGRRLLGEPRLYSAPLKKDGSLFFPELFPGRYLACFYGTPDGRARPDPFPIAVEPEPVEQDKDLSFSLSAGPCVLRGRVRDQKGRGVAGARVALFDDPGAPVPRRLSPLFARAEAACDGQGRFEIRGLAPVSYFLRRERRILRAGEPIFVDRKEDSAVTLSSGSVQTVDVEVLSYEKTVLKGRIEGLDATALPFRVSCFLEPRGGFETYRVSCRPGRDGSFLLPHVPLAGEPLVVWVLADLGGGEPMPCCRAEVSPEDGRYPFVILKREE